MVTDLLARAERETNKEKQAPAPVVARMLGYHNETVAIIAAQAAGPWSRYVPGNHTP